MASFSFSCTIVSYLRVYARHDAYHVGDDAGEQEALLLLVWVLLAIVQPRSPGVLEKNKIGNDSDRCDECALLLANAHARSS